jgi:Na+/H+ antiporter NhaD/arsenite permease-like protein
MEFKLIFGVVTFILIFLLISTEKINKTLAALGGASLFMLTAIISQEEAFAEIDWNVIFLLIGMMIIVGITKQTGLFQFVAIKMAKLAKGNPFRILLFLSIATAVFSAFLDNVTTVLILTPITILIAVELGISPVPFIISEILASNIGGTSTLIGDPPNIMIGSAAHLSFLDFIINLGPLILITMVAFSIIAYFLWGKKMHVTNERKARIMDFDESKFLKDKTLLIKSVIVLSLVILGFLTHSIMHLEAATIALGGATLLMLISKSKEVEKFFHEVEWETIFFFIGLFILVGGLAHLGVIKKMAEALIQITQGDIKNTSIIVLWGSGVISGVVDNIPYVATMIPLIKDFANDPAVLSEHISVVPLWWSLAAGACLGGNATLIGASANVVASGLAGKSGYKITFLEFTKYGIFITVVNLIISSAYIYLRYF